jgi:DNA repair exonuclease SbcCD ATPase subunit
LKDLEKKYSEIKELEMGLTDIYQAATTAREELVKKALSELQSTIGSYYSKILGHPYFVNLQLIPEEERGKAIYRIRAWDKDFKQGTYVQTRFSNAQMNAVALSLFLSMSTRLQSNLGLILLDDPSQSMDKAHKDALSKLLGEILVERQVFVATQDTEFEQCLEKSLDKAKAKICEIERWDTKGPEISS